VSHYSHISASLLLKLPDGVLSCVPENGFIGSDEEASDTG